ncbi:hypothetical protein Taro_052132, partial [Colocasia esculenta]|nr:hypothetical protein [Colocasia esculenta]
LRPQPDFSPARGGALARDSGDDLPTCAAFGPAASARAPAAPTSAASSSDKVDPVLRASRLLLRRGRSTKPVSTQTWGRGHGRRGPSRDLTDRRLESGQQWNVKMIGGTVIGESGAQFVSHMGIVSKLHCKIWQIFFVKLPAEIIDIIFRDLEHYTGKSFENAIASVPTGVNLQDWQIICAKWNTSDEQNIADRNKANRSHQSMPYRKGRKSHYQLKDDFVIMGKDRSGLIRCGGSRETRHTWYGIGEGLSSTDYQQQISNIKNTLRMEVEELRTETRRWDSEMDEMRRELEQLRKRESEMDGIRRQMLQMSTFMTQFQTSQRFTASAPPRAPEDDHIDTDAEGDDYDDDDD